MTLQRDLVGYGNKPPDKPFPNGARLAISLVVNNASAPPKECPVKKHGKL